MREFGPARLVTPRDVGDDQVFFKKSVAEFSGTDVVLLSPAQMVTADMVPDNIDIWIYHRQKVTTCKPA
jgi:hypothetical protein